MPEHIVLSPIEALRRRLEEATKLLAKEGAHNQRLAVAASIRALHQYLSTISPPLHLEPLEACLNALLDLEAGARPALLDVTVVGRPTADIKTHERRGLLSAAVTFLIERPAVGISEDEACSYVARVAEKYSLRPNANEPLDGASTKTLRKEVLRTQRSKKGVRVGQPAEVQKFAAKVAQDRLGLAVHDEIITVLLGSGLPSTREERMNKVRFLLREYPK
jgi:hypothetical protein